MPREIKEKYNKWYEVLREIEDDEKYLKELRWYIYLMWWAKKIYWGYENYKSNWYRYNIKNWLKKIFYKYSPSLTQTNNYELTPDKELCNDIYDVIKKRYVSLKNEIEKKKSSIKFTP